MITFANEIAIAGYKLDVEDFEYIIMIEWKSHQLAYNTVEEFLFHSLACIKFCDTIRETTGIWLPSSSILRKLNNMRKSNQL